MRTQLIIYSASLYKPYEAFHHPTYRRAEKENGVRGGGVCRDPRAVEQDARYQRRPTKRTVDSVLLEL